MDVELANLSNMNLVRMHGVGVYMAAPLTHYTPQYKPEFDFVALFTPFGGSIIHSEHLFSLLPPF